MDLPQHDHRIAHASAVGAMLVCSSWWGLHVEVDYSECLGAGLRRGDILKRDFLVISGGVGVATFLFIRCASCVVREFVR